MAPRCTESGFQWIMETRSLHWRHVFFTRTLYFRFLHRPLSLPVLPPHTTTHYHNHYNHFSFSLLPLCNMAAPINLLLVKVVCRKTLTFSTESSFISEHFFFFSANMRAQWRKGPVEKKHTCTNSKTQTQKKSSFWHPLSFPRYVSWYKIDKTIQVESSPPVVSRMSFLCRPAMGVFCLPLTSQYFR